MKPRLDCVGVASQTCSNPSSFVEGTSRLRPMTVSAPMPKGSSGMKDGFGYKNEAKRSLSTRSLARTVFGLSKLLFPNNAMLSRCFKALVSSSSVINKD